MKCPECGKEMRNGYLFCSKDGAFSFANEVPGVFTDAKTADAGRGGHVAACVRRLFFLPVPTHLEPSIDGDRIKHSHTPPTMREKP